MESDKPRQPLKLPIPTPLKNLQVVGFFPNEVARTRIYTISNRKTLKIIENILATEMVQVPYCEHCWRNHPRAYIILTATDGRKAAIEMVAHHILLYGDHVDVIPKNRAEEFSLAAKLVQLVRRRHGGKDVIFRLDWESDEEYKSWVKKFSLAQDQTPAPA